MAVNIDTVYQTVQALANKEQRGYLTPQEFNLFANQAQLDIFEQYFYDLNAFREAKGEKHEIGDGVQRITEKLRRTSGVSVVGNATVAGGTDLPNGNTGKIFITHPLGGRASIRPIEPDTIKNLQGSRWHKEAFDEAVYFEDGLTATGTKRIQVHTGAGQIATGITCENVTGSPGLVYWGYTIVNERPVYDPSSSANFGLPSEERPDLVIKILELAGISIEDAQLAGIANQEESQNIQQENK